jgi:hypothetical protein
MMNGRGAKMANGHGGKRPGAGRKKKELQVTPPPNGNTTSTAKASSLEEMLNRIVKENANERIKPEEFKQLVHEVAYMRQELEFIKKIILVSVGGQPK